MEEKALQEFGRLIMQIRDLSIEDSESHLKYNFKKILSTLTPEQTETVNKLISVVVDVSLDKSMYFFSKSGIDFKFLYQQVDSDEPIDLPSVALDLNGGGLHFEYDEDEDEGWIRFSKKPYYNTLELDE